MPSNYTASLKTVVAPLGITSADVDACLASTELRNGVLAIKQAGQNTYGISGTPTFIINGQKVVGAYPTPTSRRSSIRSRSAFGWRPATWGSLNGYRVWYPVPQSRTSSVEER